MPHAPSIARPAAGDRALSDPRRVRWLALGAIALAQLMVILDATVVNIALPSMQADLGFSDAARQWVVTTYVVAFGGLLMLGGRLADMWDRRRLFIIGLVGFALASGLGGAAPSLGVLLVARVGQGVFATLLTPIAMSLVAVMFPRGRERSIAFGVFSAVGMAGSAVGLVLGGALTEYLSWRWCMYVNIVLALPAVLGALLLVPPVAERAEGRVDVAGAALGTAGVVAVVYGFSTAESAGWSSPACWLCFVVGGLALATFAAIERRAANPILPPRVIADRTRAGVYLAVLLSQIANYGQFLFLAYYFQQIKGWAPVTAGLAFLPMTLFLTLGTAVVGPWLVNRLPAQRIIAPGLLLAAAAFALFAQVEPASSYWVLVVPAHALMGVGLGVMFNSGSNTATLGLTTSDTGIGSAVYSTFQQLGGATGTALMNTIATSATAAWLFSHPAGSGQSGSSAAGTVHGYSVAFWVSSAVLVSAAALATLLIRAPRPDGGRPAGR